MSEPILDLREFRDFENLELFAQKVVEGFITGLHKSPFHGFSVEFAEHRIYNPGESTKNIDWKLYGRTDRLYTKRYEEETNLRCRIVIDSSGSMYYPLERLDAIEQPNKVLFASVAALALINLLKRQRDAVGLSCFGNHEVQTATKSTIRHHKLIISELEQMLQSYREGSEAKTNLAESLHIMAQNIHRRSLVILFSDLYDWVDKEDELMDALQHLKYNKHELIVFWTTDHSTELSFDFDERPYRFVDMETGKAMKLNPCEVKEAYQQKMTAFREKVKMACLQYKIELVEANVAQGYQAVLQAYLRKRNKM